MKIAMVSEHANPLATPGSVDAGGQNVHVAALSKALALRGHEISVYTRRDSQDTPTRVRMCEGVEVVHLTAGPRTHVPKDALLPYMGVFAEELAASWAYDPPDVVHGHFWMSGLASLGAIRLLAPTGSRPAVLETFHALGSVKRRYQGGADTSPAERERLEPLVGRRVDAIIATCPDEVAELRALGIAGQHIEIAPCGVDPNMFVPGSGGDSDKHYFRLLSVGRLVPRKAVDNIIRALGLLHDQGISDVSLDVVGDGSTPGASDPERTRLSGLAQDLGVADRVRFLGQVPRRRMPELFRSADAVVCTPWYEPFGIVPLESMACGVPVIVSAVGGLQSSVVDGVTGLHVTPESPASLAEAVKQLKSDERARSSYGVAGRARVEAHYTWERVAEKTEHIYTQVLARLHTPRPHLTEVSR